MVPAYAADDSMTRMPTVESISATTFERLRNLIRDESGITLSDAKRDLLSWRLSRRIRQLGLRGYEDYYRFLLTADHDGVEVQRMVNCVTTNMTDFFRENHHFEFLRDRAIREWRSNAAATSEYKLRIWSSACSRGHEPYSIAITLIEHFGPRACWDIKILATDINTDVLDVAERGIYPIEDIANLPRDIRDRHFVKGVGRRTGMVRVRDDLRRMVTFRKMNITANDWPFSGTFNAIFCRNVMIYFDESQQRELVSQITDRLAANGILFLGHSEHQSWISNYVEPLGQTIYRRRGS